MRNVSDVSWKTRITGIDVSRQCMLDYSSNRGADKNESAIVSRKITFPRASIISEWQIYRAATRAYRGDTGSDGCSLGKLSRAYLSHCRAYKRNAVGEMAEKISSRCRFWREGDNAKIVGKKSIKRDDRKENTKHY